MRLAASAVLVGLLLSPPGVARNFSRNYSATADRTFDAILELVQKDPRAHLIDLSVPERLIHFRLALDPAKATGAPDQFAGMYVLLRVNANGSKVTVNVTADRIYPVGATAQHINAEESAYAKGFLHKLQQELKR